MSDDASRVDYSHGLSENSVTPALSDAFPEPRTPTTPQTEDYASLESGKNDRLHMRADSAQPVDVMAGPGPIEDASQQDRNVSAATGYFNPETSPGSRAWEDILDSVPAVDPSSPHEPVEGDYFPRSPSAFTGTAMDTPASPTEQEANDSDDGVFVSSDLIGNERVDAIRELFEARRSRRPVPNIYQHPQSRISTPSARPLTIEEHNALYDIAQLHHNALLLTLTRVEANLATLPEPRRSHHPNPHQPSLYRQPSPTRTQKVRQTQTSLLATLPQNRAIQHSTISTARHHLRHNAPHFPPPAPSVAENHRRTAEHTTRLNAAAQPYHPPKPDVQLRRSVYLTPNMADPGSGTRVEGERPRPTSCSAGAVSDAGGVAEDAVFGGLRESGLERMRGGGSWSAGRTAELGASNRWRPLALAMKREHARLHAELRGESKGGDCMRFCVQHRW
ncbi:hypothetical protein K490DRAFT_57525 [Saccharata proteae CBS 121410]|uniref:Uncharacterized protein n=1 Tax=Saccharata proteae CBS 121410 TaxID=1314787 RepID=A0A9P4HUB5_9PEZI|nr:hypothetical protein K490DRAFT_57525 [Saccharata proteae CBS 121410]